MTTSFNFLPREYPGLLKVTKDDVSNSPGNIICNAITADAATFNELQVNEKITLADTSYVDVLQSNVYTSMDSLIMLNKAMTNPGPISESGMQIYRGQGEDMAAMLYQDNGSPGEWSAGVYPEILPLMRRGPGFIDGGIPIYSSSDKYFIGNQDLFASGAIINSRYGWTFQVEPTAGKAIHIVNTNGITPDVDQLKIYQEGEVPNESGMAFRLWPYPMLRNNKNEFHFSSLIYDAAWEFENMIRLQRMGTVDAYITPSFSDPHRFTEEIYVKDFVSVHFDSPVILSDVTINGVLSIPGSLSVGTDLSVGGNAHISGDATVDGTLHVNTFSANNLSAVKRNYLLPAGFSPIPDTWSGSLSYGGVNTTTSAEQRLNEVSYCITVSWSLTGAPGEPQPRTPYKIVFPININGDIGNLRDIRGVVVINGQSARPIDASSINVVPPYDLSPDLPLSDLAGYHLVEITFRAFLADFEAKIIVEYISS